MKFGTFSLLQNNRYVLSFGKKMEKRKLFFNLCACERDSSV